LSRCAQIPAAITHTQGEYLHLLPYEVAGWFLRKEAVEVSAWVLLMTDDSRCTLGANLVIRDPLKLNVLVGQTEVGGGAADVQVLEEQAKNLVIPAMKAVNALVEVTWDLRAHHMVGQGEAGEIGGWVECFTLLRVHVMGALWASHCFFAGMKQRKNRWICSGVKWEWWNAVVW
jgi:hypothetical protein